MNKTASPLRVLHVAAPARTGGLESVLLELTAGLRGRGHDVQVAAVLAPGSEHDHPVVTALEERGVPVHPVVLGTRDYLGERRAIRRLMEHMDAQVLHTHGFRPDVIDGSVARSMGKAHVMTLHGFSGKTRRGLLYEWLQIRAARTAQAAIVVSTPLREYLIERGISQNVYEFRNAITPRPDNYGRSEARAMLGLPQEAVLIGWVGRVSNEKGPDLFVNAIHRVPSAHGVLVGDGPDLAAVREMAHSLGIANRITTCGVVASASRYLAAFDILALTSRTEGTPMILLEAMWASLPIVATAVGGVPYILSETEAILCEPTADSIATALHAALGSADRGRGRASAARLVAARDFSAEVWLQHHEALYYSAILPL